MSQNKTVPVELLTHDTITELAIWLDEFRPLMPYETLSPDCQVLLDFMIEHHAVPVLNQEPILWEQPLDTTDVDRWRMWYRHIETDIETRRYHTYRLVGVLAAYGLLPPWVRLF